MKLDIGDNLVHLSQLVIIGAVCCILAIFTKLDTAALLTAFIGVSGALTGVHLATMQYGHVTKDLTAALTAATPSPARGQIQPLRPPPGTS